MTLGGYTDLYKPLFPYTVRRDYQTMPHPTPYVEILPAIFSALTRQPPGREVSVWLGDHADSNAAFRKGRGPTQQQNYAIAHRRASEHG